MKVDRSLIDQSIHSSVNQSIDPLNQINNQSIPSMSRKPPEPIGDEVWTVPLSIDKKSKLWQHYQISNKDIHKGWARCQLCPNKPCAWVKRSSGSTTLMNKHLKREHGLNLNKRPRSEVQQSVKESFKAGAHTAMLHRAKGNMLLAKAMISTNLSFHTMDNIEFREWIAFLNSSYHLPHRTAATKLVDVFYNSLNDRLKQVVLDADFVSITSDAATMNFTGKPYVAITAHFFHAWKLVDVVLALKFAPGSHSGMFISKLLKECLGEWGLTELPAIVTDNGSNFVAAAKELTRESVADIHVDESFRCCCHSLQLAIGDAIYYKPPANSDSSAIPADHVQNLIESVAKAVTFIRASEARLTSLNDFQTKYKAKLIKELAKIRLNKAYVATDALLMLTTGLFSSAADDAGVDEILRASALIHDELAYRDAQQQQSPPDLSDIEHQAIISRATRLILRNATRWSSTYLMLHRFLLWIVPINQTLGAYSQSEFSADQVKVIKELVQLLEPFKKATDRLQASASGPTLSSLWPELAALVTGIVHSRLQTSPARAVASVLSSSLMTRFQLTEVNESNKTCVIF